MPLATVTALQPGHGADAFAVLSRFRRSAPRACRCLLFLRHCLPAV
jgi:hypothetical protein